MPTEGGIYIHVPFCRRRCPYCDFVLIESDGSLHASFLERLKREIHDSADAHPGFSVQTLFLGGGTPSMLPPGEIAALVSIIRSRFLLSADAEISMEANPEDLDTATLSGFRKAGINRLSLGIQSFDEAHLKFLGRQHSGSDARRVLGLARESGFVNLNVDLMFGLPGQTPAQWNADLNRVLEEEVAHISVYGLTYESGTSVTRRREAGEIDALEDEASRALYLQAMEVLESAGCLQYEISNFARPGMECRHNQIYWDRRPYLGFGPGAHSFIPEVRFWNRSNVRDYLTSSDARWKREELTADQQSMERIMLGLRQRGGLALDGVPSRLLEEGLVERVGGRIRLTREGRCVADAVIEQLCASPKV